MIFADFQNVSRPQSGRFLNSSCLKSVFEKLPRFRDGLLWTIGQEIKLRFHISSPPPPPASVVCAGPEGTAKFPSKLLTFKDLTALFRH